MKESKWPYLAALFDGEGSISIGSSPFFHKKQGATYVRHYLQMSVTNCDRRLMQWLVDNFGGRFYSHERKNGWKTVYFWNPSGRKNREKILLGMMPYMVLKHRQAELALEYLRLVPHASFAEKRDELERECRALNKRGRSVSATTNTPDQQEQLPAEKIESELTGDRESELAVTQVT